MQDSNLNGKLEYICGSKIKNMNPGKLFSFFRKAPVSFKVHGPQGGISTILTLPPSFNTDSDRCPVAILMHGFMAKKEMHPIPAIAKALAEEGIASVSFDFDAHGKSEGKFVDMTISSEIADAQAVLDYVSSLPFATKTAFVGHSQGGVVAGMLAGSLEGKDNCPVALVQLAPAAVLKDDALAGRCMNARYDASNPPEYVNVMFHKLGRRFILEAQKLPIFETSCRYSGKVCLIHGSEDRIVPVSYSERYNSLYQDSTLHIVEGEGHFLNKHKQEIVGMVRDFLKEALL